MISSVNAYDVISQRYSYYLLDENGNRELSEGLPIKSEGLYSIPITIHPKKTAIIVMDPWIYNNNEYPGTHFNKVMWKKIIPLVNRARVVGHPIIFLTNIPSKNYYHSQIEPLLSKLIDNKQVYLFYHQNYTNRTFSSWLKKKGIDSLIYTGFASNQCVIARQIGVVMMRSQGLRIFFVPEASAALETLDTRDNKMLHYATSVIISQWIGSLISWDEQMNAMCN